MLPAPVMPEVLLGRTPNPTLERARIRGDDAVHVGIQGARRFHGDVLEVEHEPPARLPQRAGEQQWHAQAKGEDGWPAGRLCVAPEEWDPGRGETDRTLIDEERYGVLLAQRPRDAAYRVGIVDHR